VHFRVNRERDRALARIMSAEEKRGMKSSRMKRSTVLCDRIRAPISPFTSRFLFFLCLLHSFVKLALRFGNSVVIES